MDEHTFLYGTKNATNLDQTKEVKVKLPVEQLVKLHGLKILQGRTISESISAAIGQYLETHRVRIADRN